MPSAPAEGGRAAARRPGALRGAAARRAVVGLARAAAATGTGSIILDERPPRMPLAVGASGPTARVRVRDRRAYGAVLRQGSVGLAQSYAAGWWDTDDPTEAVRALLRLSAHARARVDRLARCPAARMFAAARGRWAPDAATDRRRIAAHYDLSNELFALMLDPTMAYSCAFFSRPDMTLEEAQVAKFDRLATKLALGPEDHVMEIGTGWGGLAVHLAERYGCRVTTTTISDAQRQAAEKLVRERRLSGRVRVLGEHYRDVTGTYDALVSVEMIEAVDWRHHDDFFAACARLLTGTGRMALQAITIDDRSYERAKQHGDFIRTLIFPGGCIPSIAAITASLARASDLVVTDVEDIGSHYVETLDRWRANLEAHRSEVTDLGFDERFWRMWRFYLCYCQAAFIERHISDVQMVLTRPGWRAPRAVRTS